MATNDGEDGPHILLPDAPDDGARTVVHNHLTRDIKPEGQCPKCDLWWKRHGHNGGLDT